MGVIPDKIEYKNCFQETASAFVEEAISRGICRRVSFSAANEKSHFDRYGLVAGSNKKVSVVFDTKAKMLSVTAPDDLSATLRKIFDEVRTKNKTNGVQTTKERPESSAKANVAPQKREKTITDSKFTAKSSAKQNNQKSRKAAQGGTVQRDEARARVSADNDGKPDKSDLKVGKDSKKNVAKTKNGKNETKKTAVRTDKQSAELDKKKDKTDEDGAADISLKKYTAERFENALAKISKEKKKYRVEGGSVVDKGKQTELVSYTVAGGGQRLKLRFMPKKQVLQLQGKKSALFSELQLILAEQTDYRAAVDAHIEQACAEQEQEKGVRRASAVEKQLKKLLPNAFDYLSEQSKIDFTIGVIELINSQGKHYDYSMLLLPPFRGLERLIFDFQKAQNIVVKMIGQAYEKENDMYVLKASYRRKIGSVVYAEVMAALYREYFEKRNYYMHSDSSERSEARMITDKAQARALFEQMLAVVDYNCKKLREIGFSVENQK